MSKVPLYWPARTRIDPLPCPVFGAEGLGVTVWDSGFRIQGIGLKVGGNPDVLGSEFSRWVQGVGFGRVQQVLGSGCRAEG